MYLSFFGRSFDGTRRYTGNFPMNKEGKAKLSERTGLSKKEIEDAIKGCRMLGLDQVTILNKPYEASLSFRKGRIPKALEGGVV